MENNILVLGLGNVLLNDEGIGVKVIEELDKSALPENVDLLDGGTGGFVLLSLFQDYNIIIIIDATLSNEPPGTIKVLKPKFASDFPKSLSTHDLGMKDMIESAILLEKVPELFLIAVTINPTQDMDMKVSEDIQKKYPEIISLIMKLINDINSRV